MKKQWWASFKEDRNHRRHRKIDAGIAEHDRTRSLWSWMIVLRENLWPTAREEVDQWELDALIAKLRRLEELVNRLSKDFLKSQVDPINVARLDTLVAKLRRFPEIMTGKRRDLIPPQREELDKR